MDVVLEKEYKNQKYKILKDESGKALHWYVDDVYTMTSQVPLNESVCEFTHDIIDNLFSLENNNVLIGGLGSGCTTDSVLRQFHNLKDQRGITTNEVTTIELFRDYIDLYEDKSIFFSHKNNRVIEADFYDHVNTSPAEEYSSIFFQIDNWGCSKEHSQYVLWEKNNERMYSLKFFEQLYSILKQNSCMIFCCFSEPLNNSFKETIIDAGFRVYEERRPYYKGDEQSMPLKDLDRVIYRCYKFEK